MALVGIEAMRFIRWYFKQLCPHPVDACILFQPIGGLLIKCERCQLVLRVPDGMVDQYNKLPVMD